MKELNQRGARLAYVDNGGFTPLHHAARLGMKDMVAYLVDKSEPYYLYVQCIIVSILTNSTHCVSSPSTITIFKCLFFGSAKRSIGLTR